MGSARVTMVESETTCAVEGINGLVGFHKALGGSGNYFLLFAPLFPLLVLPPCQECGSAPIPEATGAGFQS